MLKNIFTHSLRSIVLACLFTFVINTHAAPKKEAPIDLSIIKERKALALNMEASERIKLLKLEGQIDQAQSDMRSSQFMIDTKPSSFVPKEEAAAINKRGKHLNEDARERLASSQRELVDFLTSVKDEQAIDQAKEAKKFNFSLNTQDYETAFRESTEALLQAARENSYKTVFYDQLFISNKEGTQATSPQARNKVYDTLVEIDGTDFAISVPQGLKIDDSADSLQLTFDNIDDYEDDKLALFVVELMEKPTGENLLYFRLLDLHTHEIIAHQLTIVTQVDELLVSQKTTVSEKGSEEANVTTATEDAVVQTTAPKPVLGGANISDTEMWIDKLAQQSYKFEVASASVQSIITSALLIHTILENTSMKIVDSNFIARAYGSDETPPAKQAGAQIMIQEADDILKLSARSYSSKHTIQIGTMTLTYQ